MRWIAEPTAHWAIHVSHFWWQAGGSHATSYWASLRSRGAGWGGTQGRASNGRSELWTPTSGLRFTVHILDPVSASGPKIPSFRLIVRSSYPTVPTTLHHSHGTAS
ncbi:hypothetical protein ASPBRDRAFT_206067 [Aspergillus brasiliensis CBS 101740]|uniref:Uncharacterized protein n=1 Tax=Aspergillus brasiliensis (strain CBS 101740 / IMI 381727 / IBT 21946) TaxID=767769 RepID=A0A1L9UQC0_ASPBC|nr:hypothetical protein ASPBRDRAFT_206067 [Aspergillus brasiliensis CBS 101740]